MCKPHGRNKLIFPQTINSFNTRGSRKPHEQYLFQLHAKHFISNTLSVSNQNKNLDLTLSNPSCNFVKRKRENINKIFYLYLCAQDLVSAIILKPPCCHTKIEEVTIFWDNHILIHEIHIGTKPICDSKSCNSPQYLQQSHFLNLV